MQKLTIKEVALEAGVSTATISRVLNNNGYVSEDVRKSVLDVIERLNYQPNAIARSLKQEKSRSIGIVLPDLTNPYFMILARAIQHRCVAEGYHLLFLDTEETPSKEKEALDFLMEKRVEGVVLAGTGENADKISAIRKSGVRVVLVDRLVDGLELDVVGEDNRNAAKKAIKALLHNGHSRIGIINGPQTISTARERYAGIIEGLAEEGMTSDKELIYSGDFSRESGIRAIREFMEMQEPPTAIFSSNNEMTFGLYLGLQQLSIPLDRLEVASFGALDFSTLFRHRLSVIQQNPAEIGEAVSDILLRRLAVNAGSVEQRIVTPEWVPFQTAD